MDDTQITAFLQENWYFVALVVGVVVLVGAIMNWDWLCDPAGKPYTGWFNTRGERRLLFFLVGLLLIITGVWMLTLGP